MKNKAKKKSKNNKKVKNWMQENLKNDKAAVRDSVNETPVESKKVEPASKKSGKKKTVLLSIGLGVLVAANVLYFTGIGKRSIREIEHQTSGIISTSEGYYVGETDFGIFDGNGTLNYNGGKSLTGIWNDGSLTGKGVAEFDNLGKYEGDYEDTKRSGEGTFTWENGDVYVGEWSEDKINGKGTLTWADGSVYEGEFKDNLFSGTGTLTLSSKDKYSGSFSEGKFNGKGVLELSNGDKYDGEWSEGQLSGKVQR